jgi:hypothetical protein
VLDSCGGADGPWSRDVNMKWVGRLQPEKGTAARRALETYRSENIRDSHTAVALPRRGAPRSLVVAPGLMQLGAYGINGKRYRPTRHSLRYNTLLCPELSSHVKSRSSLYQVSVSVDSHLYCTLASTSVHSIGFYRLPVIRNRLSVVHGSRLPYLFTYL